jgi:hypothetical protein
MASAISIQFRPATPKTVNCLTSQSPIWSPHKTRGYNQTLTRALHLCGRRHGAGRPLMRSALAGTLAAPSGNSARAARRRGCYKS